jgi:hypothetical protein
MAISSRVKWDFRGNKKYFSAGILCDRCVSAAIPPEVFSQTPSGV